MSRILFIVLNIYCLKLTAFTAYASKEKLTTFKGFNKYKTKNEENILV